MQAHDDHAYTGRDRKPVAVLPKEGAEGRRRGPEGDEDRGESSDEQEGGQEDVAPRLGLALVRQRFDARAGHIGEIGRGQRQNAGADEGQKPRAERGRYRDVGHGGPDMARRKRLVN